MWSRYLAWLTMASGGHLLIMKCFALVTISFLIKIILILNKDDGKASSNLQHNLQLQPQVHQSQPKRYIAHLSFRDLAAYIIKAIKSMISSFKIKLNPWPSMLEQQCLDATYAATAVTEDGQGGAKLIDSKTYAQSLALAEAYLDLRDVTKAKRQLDELRIFDTPEVKALNQRLIQLITSKSR